MRRLALMSVAALLAVPAVAHASGGTYTVVQCDGANRADPDAVLHPSEAYSVRDYCSDLQGQHSLQIGSRKPAVADRRGLVRFATGSPDLGIVGVTLDAKLRGENGSHPRLWLADRNFGELYRITGGDSPGDGFAHYTWTTPAAAAPQFVASLSCEAPGGCPQSDQAKVWIRDVRLIVADYSDPALGTLTGSLVAGGWVKGTAQLDVLPNDAGAGLVGAMASVNGAQIGSSHNSCALVPGTGFATLLVPCPSSSHLSAAADTTVAPFRDGPNTLDVCAVDFGGNQTCDRRTVQVDNAPPTVSFADSQRPDDPELITANTADAGSGIASGSIEYRAVGSSGWSPLKTTLRDGRLEAHVDSVAVPAGDYQFMASATDAAGNTASTTSRANGQPMVLSFPLKGGTSLSAHLVPGGERRETVGYGHSSKVAGRLLKGSGRPLAHAHVTVVEHFAQGALINRRVRTLRTDGAGFFGERIPAGPSRKITASYAGSRRYLDDRARAGHLVVRSKASLHTSRRRVKEGRSVVFKGDVRHFGARIPPGGKLIELQVRDGRLWNTVRQAFYTKPDGRYRLRYRFRADYTRNAKFQFRVKIVREQAWPYRAPVRTRSRKVIVVAR